MEFLNLFKKNKKENEKTNNFDGLNGKGLIGYIRANLENPTDKNVVKALEKIAKPDDDLEHLTTEGELPWGWHTHNESFTSKIGGEYSYFLNMWLDARKKSPREEYAALNSFVTYLEDAKKMCASKGECFDFWFTEVLTSPDYIKKRKEELRSLRSNLDELQQNYIKKQECSKDLDSQIIELLKDNDGVLQSAFIGLFDECVKNDVSFKLYQMAKDGQLKRTKSGRSYILHYDTEK